MKNIIIISTIYILIFSSCKGFLDEVDQDKFIPFLVDHYASLLLNEFNNNGIPFKDIVYMTDEIAEYKGKLANSESRENIKSLYTWQKNIEINDEGKIVDRKYTWENFYRCIAITNYIFEEIDNAEGDINEINYVKAEAYFIRAYCHFILTNLYAEPYIDDTQARVTQGIPIKTDIGVNTTYGRENLFDSYRQVEKDLEEAIKLLEKNDIEKSIYHPSLGAAKLLLSRVKLYKKDYEEVIKQSTYVIDNYPLYTLNSYSSNSAFINRSNTEVIYSFFPLHGSLDQDLLVRNCFSVSDNLLDLFEEKDLRHRLFFSLINAEDEEKDYITNKAEESYSDYGKENLRSAEAYLNRAEAYAYTNKLQEAISDLNELLKRRYMNGEGYTIPNTRDELIRFIENERFKELCFEENHRWFDLRRMPEENRPQIEHLFSILDSDNKKIRTQRFFLLKNDKNYTLSLPREERNNNLYIRDYERFDKIENYN